MVGTGWVFCHPLEMTNNPHREPVVCPECGELIIASATGTTITVPSHPDLSWPQRNCAVSALVIAAPKILR